LFLELKYMKLKVLIFLFSTYSYLNNLIFLIIELLPSFLRVIFFKIALKRLGSNSLIDYKTYFRYPSKISIGDNVAINRGCEFYTSFLVKGGEITLGNNVVLSPNVRIYAIGHDPKTERLEGVAGPVVIEDDVWIAANSVLLPNVRVGRGSVVGAGSVVTKDIPPNSIAVGIPAKVIKKRVFRD
jgi:acetyltransferase-like isoleucine patch superfamily enzyme